MRNCISAIFAMFAVCCMAMEVETVSVKGKGVGPDEAAALKDAYRDAIETAVGLYVDAEQMMKNDEVIKDQILTQSNAYIEKYDMISKGEKDGLVSIKIIAKVRKQALTKRIEGVMPAKVMNIGDQLSSLHAQATTQKMRGRDAAKILAKELEELDKLKQLYEVELASAEGVPEEVENGLPRIRNGVVEMLYLFRISLNAKRYFAEVVPRLDQVLSQISIEEPRTLRCKVNVCERNFGRPLAGTESLVTRRFAVAPFLGVNSDGHVGELQIDYGNKGDRTVNPFLPPGKGQPCVVRLITFANDALTVVRAKRYVIDAECFDAYQAWAKRGDDGWQSLAQRMKFSSYVVDFDGEDGQPLSETEIQFVKNRDSAKALVCESIESGFWDITPWVGLKARYYYRWFTFKLPKDDLPKIKSIKVEVAN